MKTAEQLDGQLHDLLRDRHRLMQQHFKRCGLFNGEPPMLFLIAENKGITQRQLAQKMNITPASVTVSVRRMETEGLVKREADRKDARTLHLYLTEKGQQLNRDCLLVRDDLIERLYRGYSDQDRERMGDLLDKMRQNLLCARQEYFAQGDEIV